MNDTMITRFILHIYSNCFSAVHTIPTFNKKLLLKSLPTSDPSSPSYRPPIFFVSLCTRLSLSLTLSLSFTSPYPYTLQKRLLTHTSLPISWILTTVKGDQSESGDPTCTVGCFDYGRGLFRQGTSTSPYTLPPSPPPRHVGPGLAITGSRPSKYDSHLSLNTTRVCCTISFSHRCHGTTRHCMDHVIHA